MRTWTAQFASAGRGIARASAALATFLFVTTTCALAQPAEEAGGGEAALKVPDLSSVSSF